MDHNEYKTREQQALYHTFNIVCKAFPEFRYNSEPIGIGNEGVILLHDDDTLTKIFIRHQDERINKAIKDRIINEINTLVAFEQTPLVGIHTPVLIKEPKEHDHEHFLASYRMSRVPGKSHILLSAIQPSTPQIKSIFENAGRAMAKLHSALQNLTYGDTCFVTKNRIETSSFLDEETNNALKVTDDYLQRNSNPGIIHGDYHWGNILIDENHQVSGLIDFSLTGKSPNALSDFLYMDKTFLPDCIRGYEEESGRSIDPYLMAATKLGVMTYILNRTPDDCDESYKNRQTKEIQEQLKMLVPVM